MLNTEPIINVPIDHSVAIDVREDDYFGIKVKYAKKAGEVENLPELKTVPADDDVVHFTLGNEVYSKRINNVQNASVAIYDEKGRRLADMANQADYKSYVDSYISGLNIVQSVNGQTGNVALNKGDLGLGNVDNTSDLDKPISTATQEALNTKQDKLEAGTNIAINGNTISATFDIQPALDYTDSRLAEYNTNTVQPALQDVDDLNVAVGNINQDITNIKGRLDNVEPIVTANSQAIEDVKDDVDEVKAEVEAIDLTPYAKTTEVDTKIAEAMAGEQVQDEAMKGDIEALQRDLASEVTNRGNADTQLRQDYTAAINTAVGQIRVALDNYYTKAEVDALLKPLREAIEAFDLSNYYTKTESDARYVSLADFNAAIANLQQQITDNIGRVLTADPSENNRVWVEQA